MRGQSAGIRRFGKGIKHFFTHWTTKKVLLTLLLLMVAVGGIWWLNSRRQAGGALPAAGMNVQRTTTLERTTLQETITVTGTVKSASVTNVTATNTATVAEIFVQQGERVQKGQILCRLDTTDLESELAKKRTALAETVADAQKAYNKAVESRDTAYSNAVNSEPAVSAAQSALTDAQQKYDTAKASLFTYQNVYDGALQAERDAGAALNQILVQYETDLANQVVTDAQAAYQKAADALAFADQSLKDAKAVCDYDTLEKTWTTAQSTYDAARKNLDSLQSAYKAAADNAETAADKLEDAKKSDEIDTIQEKIDDCTIVAASAGTITTVGATVGSAPGTAPLFVIQDTDALRIAVSIDEYDVKSVSTGSRAIIKSDATGDTEIPGTLSLLSLTAQTDAAAGTSGFAAEVTVNQADSGLMIGMNAKVQLVLQEKTNVFAVPLDAVGKDEAGNSVVYAKNGGNFEPIVVTTGMQSDYLIEISGAELSEGMEIRSFADESGLVAESGAVMGQMGGVVVTEGPPQGGGMAMPATGMVGGRG